MFNIIMAVYQPFNMGKWKIKQEFFKKCRKTHIVNTTQIKISHFLLHQIGNGILFFLRNVMYK